MKVGSLAVLEGFKHRLEQAGVEVLGVTDHGFVRSIYFFDPNGIRLEFTVDMDDENISQDDIRKAHQQLADWNVEKAQRRQSLTA
jgi:catechol-2,3-dioxygenase